MRKKTKTKVTFTIDEEKAKLLKEISIRTGASQSLLINIAISKIDKILEELNYNFFEFKKD